MIFRTLLILYIFFNFINAKDNISFRTVKNKDNYNIYCKNNNIYDITLDFTLKGDGFISSKILPLTATIKANEEKQLTTVIPKIKKFKINVDYKWSLGSMDAVPDDYIYTLPFEKNKKVLVTQTYNGAFSHYGNSQYAIDFDLKMGTKVLAARGGIVVLTIENIKDNEKSKEGNKIIIKHSDGTVGVYAHLKQNKIFVKVGEYVKQGDVIALSGNSGYSTSAHLHFVVYKTKDGDERYSLPIKFYTNFGIKDYLFKGKLYSY